MNSAVLWKRLFFASLGLWLAAASAAGFFFVRGVTREGSDKRIEILLSPSERDFVLAEMRLLLEAVDGTLAGIAADDYGKASASARGGGMAMAADVNPALMGKLPLAFKNLGIGVHKDFDELAAFLESKPAPREAVKRLKGVTASCVGCHAAYRLSSSAR